MQDETTILRDKLAMDRTLLANERTLLAYVRTALALVVTGATAFHFLESRTAHLIGMLAIGVGLASAAFGAARFARMRSRILDADGRNPPGDRGPAGAA